MPPPTPHNLFVYGTLLPNLAPPVIADVVNQLTILGPATVPGQLYHLGKYPGCTLHQPCDRLIHGQLLQIPDASLLRRLDWYEHYAAHDAAGSLFLRTTCTATTPDTRQIPAWIYVYNRDVSRARLIADGRYHPVTH
jgi:gamma-glutamylcyclotransferase (GGCT)/AIG2-like uncharacterized protein YtfP